MATQKLKLKYTKVRRKTLTKREQLFLFNLLDSFVEGGNYPLDAMFASTEDKDKATQIIRVLGLYTAPRTCKCCGKVMG